MLAAGSGERLGCGPKAFAELAGRPMLTLTLDALARASLVSEIVVAAPAELVEEAERLAAGRAQVVAGGTTRQESAAAALASVPGARAIVVHDAARPMCPPSLFDACLEALDDHDAVIVAMPVVDTIKEIDEGGVASTLDRARLVAVQTPQAFRADVYRAAHEAALRDGFVASDDAALVERMGVRVRVLPGAETNFKITTPEDLARAEALLSR